MNKELKLPLWALLLNIAVIIGTIIWFNHRIDAESEKANQWKAKYESCQTQQYAKEQLNKAEELINSIEHIPATDAGEYLKNKYKNKK